MANATLPLASVGAPSASTSWTPYVATFGVLYACVCSFLRFKRRDDMARKYGFTDRASLKRMTNVEAQEITNYMGELEFPKIYYTSIQFALFKTYGIPTISSLLLATKQFSTPENAGKRYVDTGVLIGEFTGHHPKSERVIKALARLNYIHSGYQKSGKITQDDLLYTLSVFITEPISWVDRYEWRSMTEMEMCAVGTFWKSIGDAMGIEYDGRLSKTEWVDGIEFYEDIKQWAEGYEAKYMVPAESNRITANELIPLLLFYVPESARGVAKDVVGVLMGERLRVAMSHPTPSPRMQTLSLALFSFRALVLRYLCLPRPSFLRVREISDTPNANGRYHMTKYMTHPFYIAPSFWNRWGPGAWLVRIAGGDLPGSKGDKYVPGGYLMNEVGPAVLKGKGEKECRANEERLERERPAGCPFAFAR